MNAVNQTADCVNSSAGRTLFAQIAAILHQQPSLTNHVLAARFGRRSDYVRSVRSRLDIRSPGIGAKRHHRRRRTRGAVQSRAELRVLAIKLYEMRQEGLV